MFNILITDDSIINQLSVKQCIEDLNYHTMTASNGKEAIEILRTNHVDLIILDLQMPVMDGFDFLDWLQNYEDFNDIPIIVYSSMTDEETVREVLSYKIFGYHFKPSTQVDQLLFSNAIKSAVRYRKSKLELSQSNKIINNFVNKKKMANAI